jgi:prophage regulatory protein
MNYLADKTLANRYDVTRQSIWRWVREGKFPQPVKIGASTTRWKESDILDWESKQKGGDK